MIFSGSHYSVVKAHFWPILVPIFMIFIVDLIGYGFKTLFMVYYVY